MAITRARIKQEGGRKVAVAEFLVNELTRLDVTSEFKSELVKFVNEERPAVLILDWGRIVHAGSDAIGVLLALQRRLGEWKGEMRLCNMNPLLADGFARGRWGRIFSLYKDLASARKGK